MSTNVTTSPAFETAAQPRAAVRLPRWTREPLLHFLAAGALLFALDSFFVSREDDPNTIVVGAEAEKEAIDTFTAARGRRPDLRELKALQQVWLDNEVLYREGLAMEVDKGDVAIRDRVIFKALSIVDANIKVPPADDRTLREWFEARREKYDEPVRFDFQEAALTGDVSESAVRSFVAELNGGTPGDAKAGLRVFKGRPESNLIQSYGAEFASALQESTLGEWRAMQTRDGWRAIRLEAISPAKPAVYESLRGVVMHDWIDATASEMRTEQVRALTKKYKVKYEALSQ